MELEDSELSETYQRRATAVFFFPSPTTLNRQANVTLFGTTSAVIQLLPATEDGGGSDEGGGDEWYQSVGFIVPIVLFPVLILGGVLLW